MMLQSQYKYNQINCMNGKELHEETDTYESELVSFSPQMQKVRLIDHNTKYFRSLLFFSIQIGCLRLIFFFIIIIFEEHFIISQPPNNYSQSWNIMFFVLAAMMDFLGVLNDVQIFKHLQKDETLLRTIKNNLLTKTQIRMQTQIGSYVYYLSIYDIIKKYKYRSKSSISISQTIRFLHVLITICIFGNLAISWQNSVVDQTFKVIFLWGFLLSIYLSVFELDFFVLQNSSGPFIDKKSRQKDMHMQQMSESVQSSIIKNRYIKNCRRPFEICYIFNILAMLALIIVYFKLSLLTLMLIFSILAHMTELIHQKYLQNKLMDLNIEKLPYVFLNPYKILRQLTKNSRFLFGFITMSTRIIIVLAIFAFFKESETTTIQNLCMLATNFLIIFSQTVKFKRLDNTKLYILKRQIALSPQGTECSICLLQMSKSEMQYRLPCFSKHIFHEKCMKNWFDQRKQCPLCRYSLRIYELK